MWFVANGGEGILTIKQKDINNRLSRFPQKLSYVMKVYALKFELKIDT